MNSEVVISNIKPQDNCEPVPLISADVVHSAFHDGVSILHLRTGSFFRLQAAGLLMWRLLTMGTSVGAMVTVVAESYCIDRSLACKDVYVLLDQLRAAGLIDEQSLPELGT